MVKLILKSEQPNNDIRCYVIIKWHHEMTYLMQMGCSELASG